jgi:hypothetical protein
MELKVWQCDRCEQAFRTAAGVSVAFPVGRETDASGDTDMVSKSADLCPCCLRNLVDDLMKTRNAAEVSVLAIRWCAK